MGQPLTTTWVRPSEAWTKGVPQLRSQIPARSTRQTSSPSERSKAATNGRFRSSQAMTIQSPCSAGELA